MPTIKEILTIRDFMAMVLVIRLYDDQVLLMLHLVFWFFVNLIKSINNDKESNIP